MTEPRRLGRPPKPSGRKETFSVRLPPDLKTAAADVAEGHGETLTAVIEGFLGRYIAGGSDGPTSVAHPLATRLDELLAARSGLSGTDRRWLERTVRTAIEAVQSHPNG